MALPISGPLSLTDIQTEFGGSNPIGINEYYAGGGLVPPGTSGTNGAVPSSGAISINKLKVENAESMLTTNDLIASKYILVGKGKKNNYLLVVS